MDSRGHSILECNGIAVHPATHPVSALDFKRSLDLSGRGPLGPKFLHACGERSVAASEAALLTLRLASLVHSLAILTGAGFRKESTPMIAALPEAESRWLQR